VKIISHRGGRGFGIDNTLEAMEKAVRAGVRAIETDVRATADGQLLICHDATIWGRVVRRATFDELRRYSPERPLLSEVLERLAGWVTFDIEIKEAPAREVGEMLELYGIAHDVTVTSFDRDEIVAYKTYFPGAVTGFLYRMPYGREKKIERALEAGAGILAPHFNSIDHSLVREAHGEGLEVYAWTVNDEHDFRKLHSWGVDGVITDHYLRMCELLASIEAGGEQTPNG
jgi:glycerophosphoryl diester phosphodiesterase